MRICPTCQTRFTEPVPFCPNDGAPTMDEQQEPAVDPLIGRVIDGRYRVEKILGEGGMGVVYAITHAVLGKRMALKVLRGDMARDSDVVQRFVQEAQSATQIGHQNIIDISDFGRLPDGSVYFVMEFLDGSSLTKLIARGGSIPTVTAIHVIKQIASALEAAHQRGIVHRDLKPDNIYLVKQGQDESFVKVLDFGIAKVGGASSKLTKTGMIFGTPHYMSPEQAAGQTVDRRTDVYALGVIMYEMFTGRVPFDGDTFMGILSKHMFEPPKPPSQLIAGAGTNPLGAIEDVILHALEKKPEQRYASMAELIGDLEKVQAGGVLQIGRGGVVPPSDLADMLEPPSRTELRIGQSIPTPQPIEAPKRSGGPKWVGAAAALALLGIVAGGAAFALSGSLPLGAPPAETGPATPVVAVPPMPPPAPVTVPVVPPVSVPGSPVAGPALGAAGSPMDPTIAVPAPLPIPAPTPAEPVAVEVSSEPAGAEVLLDGAVLGTTPVRIPRPTSGERTVVVRMRGYEEARVMVSALSDETLRVALRRASGRGHSGSSGTSASGSSGRGGPATGGEGATGAAGGRGGDDREHSSEVVDPWNL
jgi:predicted Ser/Thr protein kinase